MVILVGILQRIYISNNYSTHEIETFVQMWGSTALGFSGIGGTIYDF